MILTGRNLGERQKELNTKVNQAVSKNINFEEVKTQIENGDVDRLFKIDLASKYRNVDYILDVLKCGDSLYISRALKCIWLYDDKLSHIINSDYLHHNIFPFMSTKMKKKMLCTISMYVKNDRAASFYKYCVNMKCINIAFKFLIFTSEPFKLETLSEPDTFRKIKDIGKHFIKNLIGNSFVLIEAYLNNLSKWEGVQLLHEFSYLYSVSDVTYLELLEKYHKNDPTYNHPQLGLKISKSIIKKHKDRIRKYPILYLTIINKTILVKYSTIDDVKLYADLLPPEWILNFYGQNKSLVDLLPYEERLQFLKNIFTRVYPNEEFEMSSYFFSLEYYKLMSIDEREAWALRHLELGSMLHGCGRCFVWYKFVSFEKALEPLKKYIMITIDTDKRAEIIAILVETATKAEHLEILLNYYYERHVNEQQHLKERFIETVLTVHDVFNFTNSCWTAFNKLFYSLEVYNDFSYYGRKSDYRDIALIYYIVHGMDVPDVLKQTIDSDNISLYSLKARTEVLNEERQELVYKYIFEFYFNKFQDAFNNEELQEHLPPEDDDKKKQTVRKYVHNILDLMGQFNKPEKDTPEILIKYMNLDWDEFHHYLVCPRDRAELTQEDLLRFLKKNANVMVFKLPIIKENLNIFYGSRSFRLGKLLKKLKVYFSNDIAKDYVDFFVEILSEPELSRKLAWHAVYGIFQLADDNFKIEFMSKYVPTEPKIDHSTIDPKLLCIQKAICSLACYSRPPIPLSNILSYIKGDYIHSCLPIFNSYLAKLPPSSRTKFVKSVIDAPLSVQKHGIRSAFICFSADDLKKLILEVWKGTKNVSLRKIVYKALFSKILQTDSHDVQIELFEVLKTFTLDLHEEDDHELFGLLVSNRLPVDFNNDFLEICWEVVNKLPENSECIQHRTRVVHCIKHNMRSVRDNLLATIINDHINSVLDEDQFCPHGNDLYCSLVAAKWELTAKYLLNYSGDEESKKKMGFLQLIIDKCFKMWNTLYGDFYYAKQFFYPFLSELEHESYSHDHDVLSYKQSNTVFEQILQHLESTLSLNEIYDTVWDFRLSIITRTIIIDRKLKIAEDGNAVDLMVINESVVTFAKEFVNLVKLHIAKNTFYMSAFDDIISIFDKHQQRLSSFLVDYINLARLERQSSNENLHADSFDESHTNCTNLKNNIIVLICVGLVEIEIFETYTLALKLLPCFYSGEYENEYLSVISKINLFDNGDIQHRFYKRFNNSFMRK